MSRLAASSLTGLLLALTPLFAQTPMRGDPPVHKPPIHPATRQELDHLEAVKLYGRGVVEEHQHRLIDAMHTFEEALRLDPESPAPRRALIPLYFALDRVDDALAACRRVLELDADDYETAYRYAHRLQTLDKPKEAIAALVRASDSPRLKDQLEFRARIFFDLGQMYEEADQLDDAIECLREVLAVLDNPAALMEQGPYNREEIVAQAAETYEHLGRVYLKAKNRTQAIEAFRQALKKDPLRSARLSYNLAEVYADQGEPRKALEQLEDYLRSQPQGMDGYELRMRLQRKIGRAVDVLPSLKRSAEADRNNTALQLLLAREYRKAGRGGAMAAKEIYTKLLEQSPTVEAYRGLFRLYVEQKQTALLLNTLDKELGKAGGDDVKDDKDEAAKQARKEAARQAAAKARTMLIVLRDDADLVKKVLPIAAARLKSRVGVKYTTCLMLAKLAGRTRQYRDAEILYRQCLAHPRPENEAEIYQGLLTVLTLAHDNEAIIALCNKGLETAKATNRVLFLRELAAAYMASGRVREALKKADEAVKTAGSHESILHCSLQRAGLLAQADKVDKAVAECQKLLKEYQQPGEIHSIRSMLSAVYSTAHQPAKAEEQLLLVLKDDPNDATANNDLGYLWADQNKKLDEAEERIRKALKLDRQQRSNLQSTRVGLDGDRDNAAFVDSLGWVLFRKGDFDAAIRELEKASSLPGGDDDPVVWDHLGDVYFRRQDLDKAGSAWRTALELYESGGRRRPDDRYREIKEKLKRLGP